MNSVREMNLALRQIRLRIISVFARTVQTNIDKFVHLRTKEPVVVGNSITIPYKLETNESGIKSAILGTVKTARRTDVKLSSIAINDSSIVLKFETIKKATDSIKKVANSE